MNKEGKHSFRALNLLCGGRLREKCYTSSDALALINTFTWEPYRELYSTVLQL